MSVENLTTETNAPEFGAVTCCAPDDRAELFDLYRAACPSATFADFESDIADDQAYWVILRSKDGPILAAMMVTVRGCVIPLVHPKEAASPWAVDAVVKLAEEVSRHLVAGRITPPVYIAISHELDALAAQLERCGFIGKEFFSVRVLHFDGAGRVARAN